MAEKKKETKRALERVYVVPLRREFQKAPKYKRAKKAVNALRSFISKHMKSDDVKIGRYLNLELWKNGIRNPPHHVKVNAVKYDDGKVIVELFGKVIEEPKKEVKEKKKEGEKKETKEKKEEKAKGKKAEKTEAKKAEKKEESKLEEAASSVEEKKEEKKEEAKEIEKEEIKELKKQPKTHAPKESPKPKELHLRKKEMIPGR